MTTPLNKSFTVQEKRLAEDEYLIARYSPTATHILYFTPPDPNIKLDVVKHKRNMHGHKIDEFESYYYMGFHKLLVPIDDNIIRKFYGNSIHTKK